MKSARESPSLPRKLARLFERIDLSQRRVLDLGSGKGQYLRHFGAGSLGVDADRTRLAQAKDLGLAMEWRDLQQAGWSAGLSGFEAAYLCDILVHLPRPELCLKELAACLIPGAPLCVVEWVLPSRGRLATAAALAVPGARAHFAHPEHLQRFTEVALVKLLEAHGFRLRQVLLHSFPQIWIELPGAEACLRRFWPPRTLIAERP